MPSKTNCWVLHVSPVLRDVGISGAEVNAMPTLPEKLQEFLRLIVKAREDLREIFIVHVSGNSFADYLAEVCRQG